MQIDKYEKPYQYIEGQKPYDHIIYLVKAFGKIMIKILDKLGIQECTSILQRPTIISQLLPVY